MLPEEISIYKRIELMQEYVHNECEAYVYNPNDKNYQIFLRIKHLVDNLSQSAFILLKQQKTLFRGNAAKISLQDIEQLIKFIYLACSSVATPEEIYKNILNEIMKINANLMVLIY